MDKDKLAKYIKLSQSVQKKRKFKARLDITAVERARTKRVRRGK